jgi:hypothetical protein
VAEINESFNEHEIVKMMTAFAEYFAVVSSCYSIWSTCCVKAAVLMK